MTDAIEQLHRTLGFRFEDRGGMRVKVDDEGGVGTGTADEAVMYDMLVQALGDVIPRAWPDKLTSELRAILGMMCFELGPIAHLYQRAGEFVGADGDLKRRAEDEQAFMLHRMLGLWFALGDGWSDAMGRDLTRLVAAAKETRHG